MEKYAPYWYGWIEPLLPTLRWLRLAVPSLLLGGICLFAAAWTMTAAASGGSGSPLRLTASVDPNKCANCHQFDPMLSHPVNVAPSMTVPSHLPLTEGRMTCQTCHTEGGLEAHAEATRTHSGMLRMDAQLLCSQCHSGAEHTASSMHPTGIGRAHLQAPIRNGSTPSLGTLDAETHSCLTCHDGSVATDVSGGMTQGAAVRSGNHPIGIRHENTLRGTGRTKYQSDMPVVPASSLPHRIRLFDERIGCGSCHSPYSNEKQYLVMSNAGSRLCLTCHGG